MPCLKSIFIARDVASQDVNKQKIKSENVTSDGNHLAYKGRQAKEESESLGRRKLQISASFAET